MDIAGVDVEIDVIKEYPELEDLVVNPSTEKQNFNSNKYGYKSVIINEIKGEELDLNPSTAEQNVEGVFTKVKVNPIQSEELNTIPTTEEQVITGMFNKVVVNAIEGKTLNLNPTEEQQRAEGVFTQVNINPIQVEEITTDLDFSGSESIELTAQEGAYIKKATINKDANLVPENIKSGVNVCGISGQIADSADADATANDILLNKTAYVGNQKVVGTLELFDVNQIRSCYELFINNTEIEQFKGFNATNIKSMYRMFRECTNLKEVQISNTGKVKSFQELFYKCKLKHAPELDLSSATENNAANSIFSECNELETAPSYNLNNPIFASFYYNCYNLKTAGAITCDKVNYVGNNFYNCTNLTDFGGLINIGKAYTQKSQNVSGYKVDLSPCTSLSHESLMNILNGLYDLNLSYNIAGGGTLYKQMLLIGTTNLAKLSSDEIAIATSKGWNVS